jgi:hypothetical protein
LVLKQYVLCLTPSIGYAKELYCTNSSGKSLPEPSKKLKNYKVFEFLFLNGDKNKNYEENHSYTFKNRKSPYSTLRKLKWLR